MTDNDRSHQMLAMFQSGRWAQAIPDLRQPVEANARNAEIAAAQGIYQIFMDGLGDVDSALLATDRVDAAALLHQDTGTDWPEVAACRAWLSFLQQWLVSPGHVPEALDQLVSQTHEARWFPVQALVLRALAFCDLRETLLKLVTGQSFPARGGGWALIMAEALLECGQVSDIALPDDMSGDDYLPLDATVGGRWKKVLEAEIGWATGPEPGEDDSVMATIDDLLGAAPPPFLDPYSAAEWDRITRRAELLSIRFAIAQQDIDNAARRISRTVDRSGVSWETEYLDGMVSWAKGDHDRAGELLARSLEINPLQSRVSFELETLRSDRNDLDIYPEPQAIPAVYDMLASCASTLYRLGRTDEAGTLLERLDRPEAPFSLRLVWPKARRARIAQGWNIRGYLAEADRHWLEAARSYDASRRYQITDRAEARTSEFTHRARRTYLLHRHLSALERTEEDPLFGEYQKDLALLWMRPLIGTAMFYRGLATGDVTPERTLSGWRALPRQAAWVETVQQIVPAWLLEIGDRLLNAGLENDALIVYQQANKALVPGASERILALKLRGGLADRDTLAGLVDAASLSSSLTDCMLLVMLNLAFQPPDIAGARILIEQAAKQDPTHPLVKVGRLLLDLAEGRPQAMTELRTAGEYGFDLSLPVALRAGLNLLCNPDDMNVLRAFKDALKEGWNTACPAPPEEFVARCLYRQWEQSGAEKALEEARAMEAEGLPVPPGWMAFLYASEAVRQALDGDFEKADLLQRQGLSYMSEVK